MTLGLVMIVKNESERIEACLDAVKPYVDSYTIVDTGSTDDTISKIERFETAPGEGTQVYRRKWVNFGYNRTEALALAKDTADWLLCLDADMIAEFGLIYRDCSFLRGTDVEAFSLETAPNPSVWSNRLPLLLRGDVAWKYVGAVHEYLAKVDGTPIISASTDAITIRTENRSSPEKNRYYVSLLEAEVADKTQPLNPRSLFYLAKTYQELGDPRALDVFRRRSALNPGAEETYISLIRQGELEQWPNCIANCWIPAFEWRPWRLEAQYHLSRVLRDHNYFRLAYWYASQSDMPNPDTLFVDTWIADWGMKFEKSISAQRLGYDEEALRLCDELLANKRLPENVREAVIRNRKFSV